jgi:hypothetical protein
VSPHEWVQARRQLLVKEKELTRALDALAAERRRLPMVRVEQSYSFEGPDGTASLLDLFEGRRQLIIYHFMFAPNEDSAKAGRRATRALGVRRLRTTSAISRISTPGTRPLCSFRVPGKLRSSTSGEVPSKGV